MVRPEGFEPSAYALEGHCSIQLSYGRTFNMVRPIGFEPITLGAEIRNSIQLSHERYYIYIIVIIFIFYFFLWGGMRGSNP